MALLNWLKEKFGRRTGDAAVATGLLLSNCPDVFADDSGDDRFIWTQVLCTSDGDDPFAWPHHSVGGTELTESQTTTTTLPPWEQE